MAEYKVEITNQIVISGENEINELQSSINIYRNQLEQLSSSCLKYLSDLEKEITRIRAIIDKGEESNCSDVLLAKYKGLLLAKDMFNKTMRL